MVITPVIWGVTCYQRTPACAPGIPHYDSRWGIFIPHPLSQMKNKAAFGTPPTQAHHSQRSVNECRSRLYFSNELRGHCWAHSVYCSSCSPVTVSLYRRDGQTAILRFCKSLALHLWSANWRCNAIQASEKKIKMHICLPAKMCAFIV